MLEKSITFTDFNGQKRTEKFYFNLSPAEVMEMELGTDGGYSQRLQAMINSQTPSEMYATFRKIILKAYGEKSADGRMFIKSEELSDQFTYTNAYSELILELITGGAKAVADFCNGILPQDLNERIEGIAQAAQTQANTKNIVDMTTTNK